MKLFTISYDTNICAKRLNDFMLNETIIDLYKFLIFKDINYLNKDYERWIQKDDRNLLWLIDFLDSLFLEYKNRFNKEHICKKNIKVLYSKVFKRNKKLIVASKKIYGCIRPAKFLENFGSHKKYIDKTKNHFEKMEQYLLMMEKII